MHPRFTETGHERNARKKLLEKEPRREMKDCTETGAVRGL